MLQIAHQINHLKELRTRCHVDRRSAVRVVDGILALNLGAEAKVDELDDERVRVDDDVVAFEVAVGDAARGHVVQHVNLERKSGTKFVEFGFHSTTPRAYRKTHGTNHETKWKKDLKSS